MGMNLALDRLLDFVLDGEDAQLVRAAGPATPELPRLLLQARAVVELLVGGPDEVGPHVGGRLAFVQRLARPPQRVGVFHAAASRDPHFTRRLQSRLSVAEQMHHLNFVPSSDDSSITRARVGLSASATPPTARVKLGRLIIELRRSEADLSRTLVVDLSLSPKRAWVRGWVLWFPEDGVVRRARFDEGGVAELPWPGQGSAALRVDADRAIVIELQISP